jgi:hypothetical protein
MITEVAVRRIQTCDGSRCVAKCPRACAIVERVVSVRCPTLASAPNRRLEWAGGLVLPAGVVGSNPKDHHCGV